MTPITYPFDTPPKIGEAIEIADGVLWLRLPLPMALDHVNIFALRDGDGWCVIDSGYYSKDAIALWQDILRGALGGLPITRLILNPSSSRPCRHDGLVANDAERKALYQPYGLAIFADDDTGCV